MDSRIVVVGSLNMDLVIRMRRFPLPGETIVGTDFGTFQGGKGANQAYAAARLGGNVQMVGQVGNDSYAEELKQQLAFVGVEVSSVGRDPDVSSGIAVISIDADGQNQIVIIPGANGTFGVEQLARTQDVIAGARIVLLQFEVPIETVTAAARQARKTEALVILDPAPARQISDELLGLADFITPNETELAWLVDDSPGGDFNGEHAAEKAQRLLARGANRVIVKMGASGALLVARGYQHFWPAVPVEAVDTTAAGDAFNGAFAVALASGKNELEAGQFATAAAACSVMRRGAQASMPSHQEVDALLLQQPGETLTTKSEGHDHE